MLILAYNHLNLFRRLCLPAEQSRHFVQSLRWLVLAAPGRVEHEAQQLVIRCEPRGPQVKLLPQIMAALERWLTPLSELRAAPLAT